MSVRGSVAGFAASVALLAAACSLASDFDGLSNPPDPVDASFDASPTETGTGDSGGIDGETSGDASDASTDADSGPCGSPGPTTGLIAYYPFDEGTGNKVHDCSPNKLDGTILVQGINGNWTTGKRGGALQVTEPNGCIDLGNGSLQQPATFTVSVWIWIDAFPIVTASGYILGKANNAQADGFRVGTRINADGGAQVIGFLQSGASGDEAFGAPATASWHHVAVTFAPGVKLEMFLDGVSMHVKSSPTAIVYSSAPLRIGCRSDNANFYSGRIDELRFYDRVLTQSEITSLAQ